MRYQTLDIEQIVAPAKPKNGQRLPTPEELDAVKTNGVPVAINVRRIDGEGARARYEIISGYEWWKAAVLCGELQIPSVIHTRQRVVLDAKHPRCPMARARAIRSLLEQTPNLRLKDLAVRIGTTLSNLSHYLRLLELPAPIQRDIEKGLISYGQARVLLGLQSTNDQLQLASVVKVQKLSVRVLERVVRLMVESRMNLQDALNAAKNRATERTNNTIAPTPDDRGAHEAQTKDPNLIQLEQQLTAQLGSNVEIRTTQNQQGELVIKYDNLDIFEGILDHLLRREREFDWE